jgi:hypothetical protein
MELKVSCHDKHGYRQYVLNELSASRMASGRGREEGQRSWRRR